jgi:hypothetical protein
MTHRIAPLYESLQREMTALWSQYSDAQLALILDFLIKSCDLAVQEIAKLQGKDGTSRRRGGARKRTRPASRRPR